MTSSQANASPLRQRMIDDMRMRQLAPKTQEAYLRIVREFCRHCGAPMIVIDILERSAPIRGPPTQRGET
jgi:hypothetical protein